MSVQEQGMIDIASKPIVRRKAIATGEVILSRLSLQHIRENTNPKGDVLENAKLAAINAVKKTPEIVFMCHPIQITSVKVNFELFDDRVQVFVTVQALDRTGVEIEAINGVMAALLAIFDVSKRYEKDETGNYPVARIQNIYVLEKEKEEFKG